MTHWCNGKHISLPLQGTNVQIKKQTKLFKLIIFIEKKVNDAFPIRIYNPDGIEVSACGNGSRCIAYLISKENNQKKNKIESRQ